MKIWHITLIMSIFFGMLIAPIKYQMSEVAYRIAQLDLTLFIVGIGIIAAIESTKKEKKK